MESAPRRRRLLVAAVVVRWQRWRRAHRELSMRAPGWDQPK